HMPSSPATVAAEASTAVRAWASVRSSRTLRRRLSPTAPVRSISSSVSASASSSCAVCSLCRTRARSARKSRTARRSSRAAGSDPPGTPWWLSAWAWLPTAKVLPVTSPMRTAGSSCAMCPGSPLRPGAAVGGTGVVADGEGGPLDPVDVHGTVADVDDLLHELAGLVPGFGQRLAHSAPDPVLDAAQVPGHVHLLELGSGAHRRQFPHGRRGSL